MTVVAPMTSKAMQRVLDFVGDEWISSAAVAKALSMDPRATGSILKFLFKRGLLMHRRIAPDLRVRSIHVSEYRKKGELKCPKEPRKMTVGDCPSERQAPVA